ncbi:chemotaxis protein CheA [Derxia lacustris]|uniref:chemotaxis protein CheA n=1 Tax=Derxia lacustris TaxID=764842 RepID=UPI001C388971|nr:chemotaxis protein CheA [Derxia lacustris]
MTDDELLEASRSAFFEEAGEMLRQFETALLDMERGTSDAETLGAAFRAAHTIKGSAGLFGFEPVVRFTHDVETLLDALRDGRVLADAALLALLIESRDQIEALIGEIGLDRSDAAVAERGVALGRRLRDRLDGGGTGASAPVPAPVPMSAAGAPRQWRLKLRFDEPTFRDGFDPLSFLRYLATLGSVKRVRPVCPTLPTLDALDPESCHLGFELILETAARVEAIRDVFSFALELCALDIEPLDPPADTGPAAAAPGAEAGAKADRPVAVPPVARSAPATTPVIASSAATAPAAEPATPPQRDDKARFLRIRADKLDHLIDLIGELVIASSGAQLVADSERSPRFSESAARIRDLVEQARNDALGLRMVPIGESFARFQRVVRDVSRQLGKDVELQITGGDTELDKSMVELVTDPLMHLVRNSLDHGIEGPDERSAAGKSPRGRLALNACQEAGQIVIEVSDDGRGLNRERIVKRALERGLIDHPPATDGEIDELIFLPGFSTAEQISDLSGRGVGMDVVRRNVESLRGQIQIASQPGEGTTMQLRLPLTLAIIDGFLTSVGPVHYVVPLENLVECIETPAECAAVPDAESGCFDLRGEVLPWLDLARYFGHEPQASARRSLIVVRAGGGKVGFVVDRLLGEYQTVIKPLGELFRHLRCIAGSTVLGSGEVALIVDVPALVSRIAAQGGRMRAAELRRGAG